jgi:ABC-type branched-subunit amino acid transport system ATPase component
MLERVLWPRGRRTVTARAVAPRLETLAAALDLADRGYVLQTGRVVLEGRSEELRDSDLVRQAYLGM